MSESKRVNPEGTTFINLGPALLQRLRIAKILTGKSQSVLVSEALAPFLDKLLADQGYSIKTKASKR